MPAALTILYTDAVSVRSLLSSEGVDLRLDDDADGTVGDPEESDRIDIDAINYATARCNLYLANRYAPSQMADDWNVHRWATDLAAVWMCERRGNPCPESLLQRQADSMEEMAAVRAGQLDLAESSERVADLPSFSNVTFDDRYGLRKLRVQRPISDRTPGGPAQTISMPAEILGGIEQR